MIHVRLLVDDLDDVMECLLCKFGTDLSIVVHL
jgi:hypothetical protein